MWYEKTGKDNDVVLLSQACISRNIKGFSFPVKMSGDDKENILGMIRQAVGGMGLSFIRSDELEDAAKADLFNRYLTDLNFIRPERKTAFLLSKKEGLACQINGRDHIMVESLRSGSSINFTYKDAEELVSEIERRIPVAFSERFGFLTSDIKNVGTGVQLAYVVIIPGIVKTAGAMNILSKRLEKYDWAMKPMLQGGDIRENSLYLLSSMATLGVDENEMLARAGSVIEDVVKLERSCRVNICKKKNLLVEDQYYKSYGVLKYARRLEIGETMSHLNWLILGREYVSGRDVCLSWDQINMMIHKLTRNYSEFADKNKKPQHYAMERAKRIRETVKGDDEK